METIGDYDKSSFNGMIKGTERKRCGRKSTEIVFIPFFPPCIRIFFSLTLRGETNTPSFESLFLA